MKEKQNSNIREKLRTTNSHLAKSRKSTKTLDTNDDTQRAQRKEHNDGKNVNNRTCDNLCTISTATTLFQLP